MTRRRTLLVWLALGLALAALGWWALPRAQAAAPTPTPVITDDQVNAIAKQLYCPVCENIPLDVCGTVACAQWRELIREKLQQGWTEEQIKQYFVAQYGDRVLATPPPRGFNLLAYILPPIFILAGAYILWRALRQWYRPHLAGGEAADVGDLDEEADLAAIEDQLRRLGEDEEA